MGINTFFKIFFFKAWGQCKCNGSMAVYSSSWSSFQSKVQKDNDAFLYLCMYFSLLGSVFLSVVSTVLGIVCVRVFFKPLLVCFFCRVEVCSLLLAHGADPTLLNCHSKAAVDAAPTRELHDKLSCMLLSIYCSKWKVNSVSWTLL